MNDPYVSMELFNLGIAMEQPVGATNANLNRELSVDLVKLSNDYAFDKFKKDYIGEMAKDPMIAPVLISSIAHDWVFVNHGYSEEEFKAALFEHRSTRIPT